MAAVVAAMRTLLVINGTHSYSRGAASIAIANGDTAIPAAGSTGLAISFLVDGRIGGAMVAGMSSEEQNGAASYLDYVNGTLRYSE